MKMASDRNKIKMRGITEELVMCMENVVKVSMWRKEYDEGQKGWKEERKHLKAQVETLNRVNEEGVEGIVSLKRENKKLCRIQGQGKE